MFTAKTEHNSLQNQNDSTFIDPLAEFDASDLPTVRVVTELSVSVSCEYTTKPAGLGREMRLVDEREIMRGAQDVDTICG